MSVKRKKYSPDFKARVALEAYKGIRSITDLSQEHRIHPNLITKWRDQLLSSAPDAFERGVVQQNTTDEETTRLYAEIGRLKMEIDWLKKKL